MWSAALEKRALAVSACETILHLWGRASQELLVQHAEDLSGLLYQMADFLGDNKPRMKLVIVNPVALQACIDALAVLEDLLALPTPANPCEPLRKTLVSLKAAAAAPMRYRSATICGTFMTNSQILLHSTPKFWPLKVQVDSSQQC